MTEPEKQGQPVSAPNSSTLQNDDRRNFFRLEKNIRIACRRFSDEEIIRTLDITENISPEGLLFDSEIDAEIDSIVELTLFTEEQKLKVLGKVIRVQKTEKMYTIAARFIRIDQESRKYLQKLVSKGALHKTQ